MEREKYDPIKLLEIFDEIADGLSLERISELSGPQKIKYQELLDVFKTTNKSKSTTTQKGQTLENLVYYLLEVSGGVFKVKRNLRTSTNEIDHLVGFNTKGDLLSSKFIIPQYFNYFLSECKNYKGKISVTYVGKFCSLIQTTNVKVGIIFSFSGISGPRWKNGDGLVRKFYLSKEAIDDRYCIIDFSLPQFEQILKGESLFSIIDAQMSALRFDTDYRHFLSRHPAEDVEEEKSFEQIRTV